MLYNFLLFIFFLISIPIAIYDAIFLKKKKKDLLKRFGLKKYHFDPKNKYPIIWIHAVSVGETKASLSLVNKLKQKYQNSYIIISSVTQTGHAEARKSLKAVDKFIYFPFDFSFTIKKVFNQIKPDLIVFIETDIWYNFVNEAKKNGSKIAIVSAKMSKRSESRFLKFPIFTNMLFSKIDLILTQSKEHEKRFKNITKNKNIKTTCNLKFTNKINPASHNSLKAYRKKLNLTTQNSIIIASTHQMEEKLLVDALKTIPNLKILIAPRHPERFTAVYKTLKNLVPTSFFSNPKKDSKVIIIDKMGILDILYQISTIAIVGGSFIKNIGGHNILEPIFLNKLVFFGPYMHSQEELKKIALKYSCAIELNLKNIHENVSKFLSNPQLKLPYEKNCSYLTKLNQTTLDNTISSIDLLLIQ